MCIAGLAAAPSHPPAVGHAWYAADLPPGTPQNHMKSWAWLHRATPRSRGPRRALPVPEDVQIDAIGIVQVTRRMALDPVVPYCQMISLDWRSSHFTCNWFRYSSKAMMRVRTN
jgi:hypothetical protein